MSKYYPNKWALIKLHIKGQEETYKVFGTWLGGYLHGDSWRLNSGVELVRKAADGWLIFKGFSGSEYVVDPDRYGTSNYSFEVLNTLASTPGVEVLSKEAALTWVNEQLEKAE